LTYVGERLEVRDAIDQLETILRDVAEELAGWRARALKAESQLKGGTPPPAKHPESDAESKVLRQRVEAARVRVHELLQRLTFLEEQAREPVRGNGGAAEAAGGAK
jgi:hypothetical protein